MITLVLTLAIFVRFALPAWGMTPACAPLFVSEKVSCCQMHQVQSEMPETANECVPANTSVQSGCCCEVAAQPEASSDLHLHTPDADLRISPAVVFLLKVMTATTASAAEAVATPLCPDKPAYSSRHILALQSVLLI